MAAVNLRKELIPDSLWQLLIRLLAMEELADFFLVGGTALALRLGHRKSEDIDLFCPHDFNANVVSEALRDRFKPERLYWETNTVNAFINGIKTDLLTHPYALLEDWADVDGIRIASLPDIAAMKLNAISGRGLRKDFWDIAALLELYSLTEMVGFFQRKYPDTDSWHLLRSLSYFANADADTTPIHSFTGTTWEQVKHKISFALVKLI